MEAHAAINTSSNRLLNFLSPDNQAILAPHLKRVSMVPREVLEHPDQTIERIYFPEDGVASVVGATPSMGAHEIGLIGREGMTGLMVVLGNTRTPLQTIVQIAGSALAMDAEQLRKAMAKSPTIRDVMLMYVQVFLLQTGSTALANAAALLPQRLARWLVMCEDRLTSKHIPITHELLSIMLGVQRPGVTIVMNELEERGLIKGERGLVHILDRGTLIQVANGSYGLAEKEYERLFGRPQH
jgi:CRP-like cAMP-binding protein